SGRGLCARGGARWGPPGETPVKKGRVLLFVHGTFSRAEALRAGLMRTSDGRGLLKTARQHYDQVLDFEHPTLSVSPVLNALDLARLFATSNADVDVVCHSRGGLVTRWWLEALDPNAKRTTRVVFVGSPLNGTSLAAPNRLRRAMNLLTNVAFTIRNVSGLAALA